MADELDGLPLIQYVGVDRITVDYSSSVSPWLLKSKYYKRNKRLYHRDIPLESPRILPVSYYSGFVNQYNGVCNHLAHAASNRNKFPNVSLKWFPNGKTLLAGTQGGKFIMWNGTTFQFDDIKRFPVGTGSVTCIEWSPYGDYLIAGDEYGKLALLSPALSLLNTTLYEGLSNPILDISISPNGTKLCACADTYSPHIWDVQQCELEGLLTGENIGSTSVTCLQWHPYKSLIATGSRINVVSLWDPLSRTQISSFYAHKAPICKISWNPAGNTFITAGIDGLVKLWDLRYLKQLLVYKISTAAEAAIPIIIGPNVLKTNRIVTMPTSLAWNPVQTNIFAVGDNKSRIMHFTTDFTDPVSEVDLCQIEDRHTSTLAMDFHPFGHLLATCSDDKFVRFWSRSMPGGDNQKFIHAKDLNEPDHVKYFSLSRFNFKNKIDVDELPSVANFDK
ncbi:WD domain, G-beta repeat domain containing protein [Theileria equi strain WA]|uniref:WD domain, G-beta repeat domain containing protein n=1 Tax=Theileria equi strain WA TaxID=1537102 RepID=L1LGD6_THEEQ|nr:WD domain, G-beta repeat domain containing protein [Theileria equi strain WA]EKX74305.1 WD domain, G-beta repeat domain containing protein [Theileria equi strain WA]|eukprot:XP_004833757.1 WD domain, G-beta repeat domain containing protein [Theileria equi strain WA]